MFDEDDRETGYALALAIGIAILVSLFTMGIAAGTAIGQLGKKPSVPAVTTAATTAPSAPAVSAGAASVGAAAAPASEPAARLYFELGKADLPADAAAQLAPLVSAAQARPGKLVISGYHDASGNATANAELAKQRAFAVRDALVAAGVPAQAIELSKPIETMGGADPREARRVEVTLR